MESKRYKLKNGKYATIKGLYDDYLGKLHFYLIEVEGKEYVIEKKDFESNICINFDSNLKVRTTIEKIHLYRSYFRGNDDRLAKSFRTDDGKRAYFVWCERRKKFPCPKIEKANYPCSMCKFQKFKIIDDKVIYHHLRGFDDNRQEAFYGLYPITDDNKVYFLTFDFDKENWKENVLSICRTCNKYSLKPLLEKSQSGRGCHIWIFFENKISAKKVRILGDLILRYTMLYNPNLSFDSFDRLFPSQDKLAPGGFGNLIALPLQGSRVKEGCSRFIDQNFNLVSDIWGELEETPKISEKTVDKIIMDIEEEVPVQYYEGNKEKEMSLFSQNNQQYFDKVTATISNYICISIKKLSANAIVSLRYISSFPNPAFYIAQRKRLSTYNVPRIISLSEIENEVIKIPRGLQEEIQSTFPNMIFKEDYVMGEKINVKFTGNLYEEQEQALQALLKNNMGIICARTGFGKTVLAAKLISLRKVSTLILVHNTNIARQWRDRLNQFLDAGEEKLTGTIYGGKEDISKTVDIALFQSLNRKENLESILNNYGMVIVDEAHHVAAKTFEDIVEKIKSKYLYGLTATPKREDHLEKILYMRLGRIVYTSKKVKNSVNSKVYMKFTNCGENIAAIEQNTVYNNYNLIIDSEERNQQIVKDISDCLSKGKHIIVLSRYVKHIERLQDMLEKNNDLKNIYILNGKMKHRLLQQQLNKVKHTDSPFVLLTTMNYAGEGFDLPQLDTLMLAMPVSGKNNLQQYLGRLTRNVEEKEELSVYDYIDYSIPMMYKMYQKRLSVYKALNYKTYTSDDTNLRLSNMFSKDYKKYLLNDINKSDGGIIIKQKLSMKEYKILASKENINDWKIIISDRKSNINEKNLLNKGYQIVHKNKILQKFVILNDKIVWILPNHIQDTVALRIISKKLAEKFKKYFKTNSS